MKVNINKMLFIGRVKQVPPNHLGLDFIYRTLYVELSGIVLQTSMWFQEFKHFPFFLRDVHG